MSHLPEKLLATRRKISERFLKGVGIEIGALYGPLWVSPAARVQYVDRCDLPALRKQYPELNHLELCQVDVVDDGEQLHTFADASLDFIIANHVLEHTENPLGTIRNHLRKIKPGGVLYYALPDKRNSFDRERPLTPFDHLVADDQHGPERSRWDHYHEFSRLVDKVPPEKLDAQVRLSIERKISIHFHVWDEPSFADFVRQANAYLGDAFNVLHYQLNDTEMITVLQRK